MRKRTKIILLAFTTSILVTFTMLAPIHYPVWVLFKGSKLSRSWPDNKAVILVWNRQSPHGCYLFWPGSGRKYLITSYSEKVRTTPVIWRKNLWISKHGQYPYYFIQNGQLYATSKSTGEMLSTSRSFSVSGKWVCVSHATGDRLNNSITHLYSIDNNKVNIRQRYNDTFGWLVDNSVILISGDGKVLRVDLNTGERYCLGNIHERLEPTECHADGYLFMNKGDLFTCRNDIVRTVGPPASPRDHFTTWDDVVSIVGGMIVKTHMYPMSVVEHHLYDLNHRKLIAACARGIFYSQVISSVDANKLIAIDHDGFTIDQYVP